MSSWKRKCKRNETFSLNVLNHFSNQSHQRQCFFPHKSILPAEDILLWDFSFKADTCSAGLDVAAFLILWQWIMTASPCSEISFIWSVEIHNFSCCQLCCLEWDLKKKNPLTCISGKINKSITQLYLLMIIFIRFHEHPCFVRKKRTLIISPARNTYFTNIQFTFHLFVSNCKMHPWFQRC